MFCILRICYLEDLRIKTLEALSNSSSTWPQLVPKAEIFFLSLFIRPKLFWCPWLCKIFSFYGFLQSNHFYFNCTVVHFPRKIFITLHVFSVNYDVFEGLLHFFPRFFIGCIWNGLIWGWCHNWQKMGEFYCRNIEISLK